ncbi:MAG TPA: hypothetical protein VHM31_17305 [Polyangia bacterium]|nr:hypothetical protein [Polyangia bacterium]
MGLAGFTLADRLGAKSSPCSVAGCTRTWISIAGGKAAKLGGRGAADPSDPTSSMCDPCREAFRRAQDVQRPCDRPGCDGTWTWPAMAQVEAAAANRPAPRGLCAGCETKLSALSDQTLPCAVPGCSRTAVYSRRAQLLAGAPETTVEPPALRCAQCESVYRKLKDRPVACGINGCKHKWVWSADEQIQAYAAGLSNEPPRRMCEACKADFGAIADREVRCRTSGCKHTWTWSRGDQLDECVAGKPIPKAPRRMCESCVAIYQSVKDVERPCRRPGCKRTWTDKRGAQLARAVRGKTGDPYPQYCEICAKEMGELEDRQIPCKTENCEGTWTWTKQAQLAAGVRPEPKVEGKSEDKADEGERHSTHTNGHGPQPKGVDASSEAVVAAEPEGEAPVAEALPETSAISAAATPAAANQKRSRNRKKRRREIRPPERRCQSCVDFLKDKKTVEIPCKHCGTPIYWPPESQLQTHLGAWSEPSMCGACKRDATEAARAVEREALRAAATANQPHPPGAEAPSDAPAGDAATPEAAPAETPAAIDAGSAPQA